MWRRRTWPFRNVWIGVDGTARNKGQHQPITDPVFSANSPEENPSDALGPVSLRPFASCANTSLVASPSCCEYGAGPDPLGLVIFSRVHAEADRWREEEALLDGRARDSVREVDARKDMVCYCVWIEQGVGGTVRIERG